MIDKIITWTGQRGEHRIHITQAHRFKPCTDQEIANNPIGTDMTTVMPEGFDIQKVPAIILIGEVVQEDILGIQAEFITAGKYNSASDLLDYLVREEAQALYPDAKLVGYSTRCCNHYQRQHCYILAKKDSEEE